MKGRRRAGKGNPCRRESGSREKMKKLMLWLIRGYQRWISPLKPPCCRFYPSCSHYAAQAIRRHGAAKGGVLALWRVMRCNPLCSGGIDPVPDKWTDALLFPGRFRSRGNQKEKNS